MRIGLYGGTFDPVHCGHLVPVVEAVRSLELDRVIYLPTAQPPHKPDREMAPALARFAMVELALLDHPNLVVSSFELTSDRPAYSVDSALHFSEVYPESKLFLLVGSDSFNALDSWHRWEELVAVTRFGILMRPGWGDSAVRRGLHPRLEELLDDGRAVMVGNVPVDVSSTRLRQMLARGEPIASDLMPPLVVEYARKYSLYS